MNRLEHLLTILMEECCELAQATSKAKRFGIDEQRDLPTSNRDRMELEYSDIVATIDMLRDEGIEIRLDQARIEAKKQKVEKYLLYSIECGTFDSAQAQDSDAEIGKAQQG